MGIHIWFFIVIVAYSGAKVNGTDEVRNSITKSDPNNTNDTDGTSDTNGVYEANNASSRGETGIMNRRVETNITINTSKISNFKETDENRKSIDTDEGSNIKDDVSSTTNTTEHVYSDRFIMKTNLSQTEVENIATRNGFELKKKVIDGFYLLKRKTSVPRMSKKPIQMPANTTLKKHPMIDSFEQEKYLKRYKRQLQTNHGSLSTSPSRGVMRKQSSPVINDDHWRYMWYLRSELSYDYIYDRYSADHSYGDDGHGTCCAGIVSAVKNKQCVLGIAYNSNFAALKILDNAYYHTASDEAMAFTHYKNEIDIYSNSWGPSDDGNIYDGPDPVAEKALLTGVLEGRDGKGSIYVFASGNGGKNDDDCNCDGYSNSIYTITINSLSSTGKPAYYAEPCTAVLACTYGGDYPNPMIVTTNRSNTCTKEFQGTSASAPVATGIIALTLEANPDLTWRDVQHIIVETSSNTGLVDAERFVFNAVGKKVSRYFGFGLMNADAMISKALTWQTVPKQFHRSTQYVYPYTHSSSGYGITSSVLLKTTIKYIEHVTITIYFSSFIRGNAIFYLTSPGGTQSKILGARSRDYSLMTKVRYFRFSSVQTWGEDPSGTWKLEMDSSDFSSFELIKWKLTVYGTLTDPLRGAPKAGSYGGKCLHGNRCSKSDHCCDRKLEVCYYKSIARCYLENTGISTSDPWAVLESKFSSSTSPSEISSTTSKRTGNWLDGAGSRATKFHIRPILLLAVTGSVMALSK